MNSDDTEPRYIISVAARMVGVQAHTLRYYERIGIIEPSRSRGKIRLYSDRDIALIRQVRTLADELGINLAGIEAILQIRQHMLELQRRLEEMESELERLRQKS
jgi:MerR family transcriptional regulator/heat shock protein HspR